MELTQKTKELLSTLMVKVIKYNNSKFTTFLDFSGHVNWLDLDIHYGGYSNNTNKTSLGCITMYQDNTDQKLQELIDRLDEAYKENLNRLVKDLEYLKNAELTKLAELKAKYEGETINA